MAILLSLCALLAVQDAPTCEKCGRPVCVTSLPWMGSPSEAARKAKAEEKLVFLVHTTGDVLDPKGALCDRELGAYLQKHFVAAFQKLPAPKRGIGVLRTGAVVFYFCAPDGRVLHAVAGAVDAATLRREAAWGVDSAKKAVEECRTAEVPFKAVFRRMHAERLRRDFGLAVEPVTFDAPEPADDDPLTWRDPSGRPIAPPLIPPPIEGPDVRFRALAKEAPDGIPDRTGCRWALGPQGRVHQLLAAHALVKIELLYPTVLAIAGERAVPGPVKTVLPRDPDRCRICLSCEGE
jgi:hypothetical protein